MSLRRLSNSSIGSFPRGETFPFHQHNRNVVPICCVFSTRFLLHSVQYKLLPGTERGTQNSNSNVRLGEHPPRGICSTRTTEKPPSELKYGKILMVRNTLRVEILGCHPFSGEPKRAGAHTRPILPSASQPTTHGKQNPRQRTEGIIALSPTDSGIRYCCKGLSGFDRPVDVQYEQ